VCNFGEEMMILANNYFDQYSITFENPETYEMLLLIVVYHYAMAFLVGIVVFTFFFIFQTFRTICVLPTDVFMEEGYLVKDWWIFQMRQYYPMSMYPEVYRNYIWRQGITHAPYLEFTWVVLPTIILGFIAYPSAILLYNNENLIESVYNITAVGNQWF